MCSTADSLHSALRDGFLSDVEEVQVTDLNRPEAVKPWSHLPFKLYRSAAATCALKSLLDGQVPGLEATYTEVLAAIMAHGKDSSCFLIGGQVRDILQGKVSKDTDFNYACSAQEVATVCVKNKWTVKYKAIGPVSEPNYVLIGDESTDAYMEGFPLSFNATAECFKGDFRQNMLFYDLTNHVILDKSGHGVTDIRDRTLRVACAPTQNLDDWVASDITFGLKALRYVKFLVRSRVDGAPLSTDKTESSLIIAAIRKAFKENAKALHSPWFGIVFGAMLSTKTGVCALRSWVCEEGGSSLWPEWLPFVRPMAGYKEWLEETKCGTSTPIKRKKFKENVASKLKLKRRRLENDLLMGA